MDNQNKSEFKLSNLFVDSLPGDHSEALGPRQVRQAMYSSVSPTAVSAPSVLAYSKAVAEELGFSDDWMNSDSAAQILAGNQLFDGSQPYAACYGGHQFGNWAGQLGDGRAIGLGEKLSTKNELFELQLKGAGPTPYSRGADGRAVLRSSIREFLMSEAMHYLGIPTTRALSLVQTGDLVNRDMLYDGHPQDEHGAIVCRVARSFLRFGSFEIFAARHDHENLRKLADFTISNYFPDLGSPAPETYVTWLKEIARRTAKLMVNWMRVGFVHGVMNTDNMSILGLTIDYGPYGWIDNYDPLWTPNTTDASGRRYRFGQQPQIGLWNLERLVSALFPLFEKEASAEDILDTYLSTYEREQSEVYRRKIGLSEFKGEDDIQLFYDLFSVLKATETDMTIFFRQLANVDLECSEGQKAMIQPLLKAYYKEPTSPVIEKLITWLGAYRHRIKDDKLSKEERKAHMNQTNPKYVLRNYMAQLAIDKAEDGDARLVHSLLELLKSPYDEQAEFEEFFAKRPDWAKNKPGCSMLSCSS